MRARTDLWEPGASNRLGPPGPTIETPFVELRDIPVFRKLERLALLFKRYHCQPPSADSGQSGQALPEAT